MAIQVYNCDKDGEFEILVGIDSPVPQKKKCPVCKKTSKRVWSTPSQIKIQHSWNDRASELQRDPYTQAKAQLDSAYRNAKDKGLETAKPTEKSYMELAKKLHNERRASTKNR